MPTRRQRKDSDLFLVRLWLEDAEGGAAVWCGKVQRVVSGELRYFRNWPSLAETLLAIMDQHSTILAQPTDAEAEAEAK